MSAFAGEPGAPRGRAVRGSGPLLAGAALLLVFVAAIVIVDPRGEFPLNDDWNFALATWHFAEELEFRFARFTGMSLKLQVVWGALWTWLFGRSFEVLRASTLFLSVATLALFWRWTGELGWRGSVRLLIAGSLVAHPIFFWSSLTYMTQVPFLFFTMAALYATWKAYRQGSPGWAWAAAILTIASCFIRQTGIAVAVAGLVYPWAGRVDPRERKLALPFAAACALFAALYLGTDLLHGYPGQIQEHFRAWGGKYGVLNAAVFPFHHLGTNVQYGALFALPLLAALALTPRARTRPWIAATLFASIPVVGVGAWQIGRGNPFPYDTRGSILENLGLGPMTLRDVYILGYEYPVHVPVPGRWLFTLAAVTVGTILLMRAIRGWIEPRAESEFRLEVRLGILHSAFATLALFPSGIYFDRYALDSLWSMLVWAPFLVDWHLPRVRIAASAALALLFCFSVAATQEYLAWNRARWAAFDSLRSRGITLREMDGGYEINQYLLGGWDGEQDLGKTGFSVVDDRWILAFNRDVRGYRATSQFPYRGLLGGRAAIYVLRKEVSVRAPVAAGESEHR